jgi:hypothetical protein
VIGFIRWCDRHWQPYREGAPDGLLVTVKLAQAFLSHPKVHEITAGHVTIPGRATAAAEALGPACCLLGDAYMETLRAWATVPTCMAATEQGPPGHREKGHPDEGGHTHFWPPIPAAVTH